MIDPRRTTLVDAALAVLPLSALILFLALSSTVLTLANV